MKKLFSLLCVLFIACACGEDKLDIESEFDKNGWNDPEQPVDPGQPVDPEPVKSKRCFI